jgi:hypothetical protein
MGEHNIYFTHPQVQHMMKNGVLATQFKTEIRPCIQRDGSLVVPTGANQIKWGYGLNTVTYPTYGGEVVQILSAYVTDMTISGDVKNYYMMEDIYIWFLIYMNIATQGPSSAGQPGRSSFNEEPVQMYYPHREWNFSIRPKSLPGLRMGREVVAPTWELMAAVIESDPTVEAFTLQGAMEGLEQIQNGIGYKKENPFSGPSGKKYDSEYVLKESEGDADWFQKVISSYQKQDFSITHPTTVGSKPATNSKKSAGKDKVEDATTP